MAMTAGTVAASTTVAVSGTYPPQGVSSSLNNTRISQSAGADVTTLTFGTASGLVDLITCSDRVLTTGASATYDVYTGTDLLDLDGQTCAFRKIKLVHISIVSGADTAGVTVGNAAANGNVLFMGSQTDKQTIYPSGPPLFQGAPAGVTVDATHKNLKVLNNSAVSVTVRILIAGSSV